MQLLIEVTKQDITNAAPGYSAGSCPIARALRRTTGRCWYVIPSVFVYHMRSSLHMARTDSFVLPKSASAWAKRFDAKSFRERRRMRPTKFVVELPEEFTRK